MFISYLFIFCALFGLCRNGGENTNPKYKDLMGGAVKYDHQTGQATTFLYGGDEFGGEPFFQPRGHPGDAEDDGFLLTFVHNEETGKSGLVVIDAKTMTLITRVHIPTRVP
jgi:carotenoid cleavage dioxygenase-like enzyme